MGVRLAKFEDVNEALEIGRETLSRSTYGSTLDDAEAKKVMRKFINDKRCMMLVALHNGKIVGFFMAMIDAQWFSKDLYATDVCFCLDPKHGNYAPPMIKRFVKWARANERVKDIMLGISSGLDKDERTGRMYQNLGFSKVGGIYSLLQDNSEARN